jgi:hypothetical protein
MMRPRYQFADFVDPSKLDFVRVIASNGALDRVYGKICLLPGESAVETLARCALNPAGLSLSPTESEAEIVIRFAHDRRKKSSTRSSSTRDWKYVCTHSDSLEELQQIHKDPAARLCPIALSLNPSAAAVAILEATPAWVCWSAMCNNSSPHAIAFLRRNVDKVDWKELSGNESPDAIQLLREHVHDIYWKVLSANSCPDALDLLADCAHCIVWASFSRNACVDDARMARVLRLCPHPTTSLSWHLITHLAAGDHVFDFVQEHLHAFSGNGLSLNDHPRAIAILRKEPRLVCGYSISRNPAIFAYDYACMKAHATSIREAVLRHRMHPRYATRLHEWGLL